MVICFSGFVAWFRTGLGWRFAGWPPSHLRSVCDGFWAATLASHDWVCQNQIGCEVVRYTSALLRSWVGRISCSTDFSLFSTNSSSLTTTTLFGSEFYHCWYQSQTQGLHRSPRKCLFLFWWPVWGVVTVAELPSSAHLLTIRSSKMVSIYVIMVKQVLPTSWWVRLSKN